jgi:protein-S-isoprenylcysteine O-methyltransferase
MTSITLTICGMFIRWNAFYTLGTNFSHLLRVYEDEGAEQELITHGIYAFERHPSYLGYYFFATFLQLTIGNCLCFVLAVVILRMFFKGRVAQEEQFLLQVFKYKFVKYKKKTSSFVDWI